MREGKLDPKMLKRGIILQRRDNCTCLRDVYQTLIFKIFEYHEALVKLKGEVEPLRVADAEAETAWLREGELLIREYVEREHCPDGVLEALLARLRKDAGLKPVRRPKGAPKAKAKAKPKSLPVVKLPPRPVKNAQRATLADPVIKELLQLIVDAVGSLFQWKYNYKHFVITKQIARDFKEYKRQDRLPGHVQLGIRMQKRGQVMGGGSRVEYVILKKGPYRKQDTQTSKIEDVGYFSDFRDILRLDLLAYLASFVNPLDELCRVVMGVDGFVKAQFETRLKYSRVVDRIADLGAPRLDFVDAPRNQFLEFDDGDSQEAVATPSAS